MSENLKLWDSVKKTDPAHTKKANVKGNNLTSIKPQYQIMMATKKFGPYGETWGLKSITWDFQLVEETGLAIMHSFFYAPSIEFQITNTISIWRDGARLKPDDEFAKKCETDILTKSLSRLGFSADVFMGQFDDLRYVEEVTNEIAAEAAEKKAFKLAVPEMKKIELHLETLSTIGELREYWVERIKSKAGNSQVHNDILDLFNKFTNKLTKAAK